MRAASAGEGMVVLAFPALLGPGRVRGGRLGHPAGVFRGKARGREVRAERGERQDVCAPVPRKEEPQDPAVGEPEHMALPDAQAGHDLAGVCGHELVGEGRRAPGRLSLAAGIDRHDRASRRDDGVDDGAEDAVLLAVAVEHEHRRDGGVDAEGRAGHVAGSVGRVDERSDRGAVFGRDVDARREVRSRLVVGARHVHRRGSDAHGFLLCNRAGKAFFASPALGYHKTAALGDSHCVMSVPKKRCCQ